MATAKAPKKKLPQETNADEYRKFAKLTEALVKVPKKEVQRATRRKDR